MDGNQLREPKRAVRSKDLESLVLQKSNEENKMKSKYSSFKNDNKGEYSEQ